MEIHFEISRKLSHQKTKSIDVVLDHRTAITIQKSINMHLNFACKYNALHKCIRNTKPELHSWDYFEAIVYCFYFFFILSISSLFCCVAVCSLCPLEIYHSDHIHCHEWIWIWLHHMHDARCTMHEHTRRSLYIVHMCMHVWIAVCSVQSVHVHVHDAFVSFNESEWVFHLNNVYDDDTHIEYWILDTHLTGSSFSS